MTKERPPVSDRVAMAIVTIFVMALGFGLTGGEIIAPGGEVWWPRFPFAPGTQVERSIAILYTTDGLGPNTTLAELGYPGRKIFRLHEDHPPLRVVMTSTPANRYSGGRRVDRATDAGADWALLALDGRFDWIELANQGYSHAPDNDRNLDHHEFSVRQTGCNIDHGPFGALAYCRSRFRLAREAYRSLGIPDALVRLVRFPGGEESPAALRAAQEAGFLAMFGSRHGDKAGRDWWIPAEGGREILEIQNSRLLELFARSTSLETGLAQGRIDPRRLADSPEFLESVRRGERYAESVAADGGILNLADQWRETFALFGGVAPRYLILDAVLDYIERVHGPGAWYPSGSELALWLDARRHTLVSTRIQAGSLHVIVEPPAWWADVAPGGIPHASLVVRLPVGWDEPGRVRISHAGGAGGWRELDRSARWLHARGLAISFPLKGTTAISIER